jgi:Ca2+-binding RTX toxin-like protein
VATYRIVGNRLSGNDALSGGGGVELSIGGAGTTHAVVHNNSIWDTGSCSCGISASVGLSLNDTATGTVDVVGNTADRSGSTGLEVRNSLQPGGLMALRYFDNVVSNAQRGSVNIDAEAPTLTVEAGYNDEFSGGFESSWGGYDPGPGNLFVKPKYVDAPSGDLHLRPTSPLIDAGLVCPPGGLSNPDAEGNSRVAGGRVDMGAFELGAAPPTGVILTGTAGDDTLTGAPGADVLCGMGGGDELNGAGGGDHLNGGPGIDLISGGAGGDVAHGGPGADGISGGAGGDALFGEDGADAIVGGTGADSVNGGTGSDPCLVTRDGVHGNDQLNGGAGNDGFRADSGDLVTQAEHAAVCPPSRTGRAAR